MINTARRKEILQLKLQRSGIISRVSHNLARYMAGTSNGYTSFRFLVVCLREMDFCGLDRTTAKGILREALVKGREEARIFEETGDFLEDSHGGAEATVTALLAFPVLQLVELMA